MRFAAPFLEQVGLDGASARPRREIFDRAAATCRHRAALSMDARIILMDEPTSSLFDDAVERLFSLIGG